MTSIIYYPGYSQVVVTQNLTTQQIASITNANPMVVTTTNDHNYVPGMEVTFLIPTQFGMTQLNGLIGQVLQVSSNTLTMDINASNFTPFAYPSPLPGAYTIPSVIPNNSGKPLPPPPLPYGNENAFEGCIFNAGQP